MGPPAVTVGPVAAWLARLPATPGAPKPRCSMAAIGVSAQPTCGCVKRVPAGGRSEIPVRPTPIFRGLSPRTACLALGHKCSQAIHIEDRKNRLTHLFFTISRRRRTAMASAADRNRHCRTAMVSAANRNMKDLPLDRICARSRPIVAMPERCISIPYFHRSATRP